MDPITLAVLILVAVLVLLARNVKGIQKENEVIENASRGEATDYDAEKDKRGAAVGLFFIICLIVIAILGGAGGALGGGM